MRRGKGLAHVAALVLLAGAVAGAQEVPLPRPRPPDIDAPARNAALPAGRADADGGQQDKPPPPPEPSACQLRLAGEGAVAEIVPPIVGPGECGATDLVRLDAVLLPDQRRIAMTPAPTMRCALAEAVVRWVRTDIAAHASELGSPVKAIENYDSYSCRNRNGLPNEKLSEHAKANALDIRGIKLANGKLAVLTDASVSHAFREAARKSACERFATVLGPGSDDYHETHVHVDLIERAHGYRMCQWDVRTPEEEAAFVAAKARPPAEAQPPKPAEAAVSALAAEAFEAAKASVEDSELKPCNDAKGHRNDCAEQSRRSRH